MSSGRQEEKSQIDNENAPWEFICPISTIPMTDPYLAIPCGHNFNGPNIKAWQEKKQPCKCPNCRCLITGIIPNTALKEALSSYQKLQTEHRNLSKETETLTEFVATAVLAYEEKEETPTPLITPAKRKSLHQNYFHEKEYHETTLKKLRHIILSIYHKSKAIKGVNKLQRDTQTIKMNIKHYNEKLQQVITEQGAATLLEFSPNNAGDKTNFIKKSGNLLKTQQNRLNAFSKILKDYRDGLQKTFKDTVIMHSLLHSLHGQHAQKYDEKLTNAKKTLSFFYLAQAEKMYPKDEALFNAVRENNVNLAKFYLEQGANSNISSLIPKANIRNQYEYPLILAILNANPAMVSLLISYHSANDVKNLQACQTNSMGKKIVVHPAQTMRPITLAIAMQATLTIEDSSHIFKTLFDAEQPYLKKELLLLTVLKHAIDIQSLALTKLCLSYRPSNHRSIHNSLAPYEYAIFLNSNKDIIATLLDAKQGKYPDYQFPRLIR